MRGAPAPSTYESLPQRIIPAYAGSTRADGPLGLLPRDHPRVCGEHQRTPCSWPCPRGSSPRMRGARRCAVLDGRPERIIPAYAGSTSLWASVRLCFMDHPRVCGEHLTHLLEKGHEQGSSPRMRGAPDPAHHWDGHRGIIPAYAGSTNRSRSRCRSSGDHPRVCGEHQRTPCSWPCPRGSSPRMRGARRCAVLDGRPERIIPAYAGSTSLWASVRLCFMDHPRVCGEHLTHLLEKGHEQGSSPRMRGAPDPAHHWDGHRGIIPAYAGSTNRSRSRCRSSGDHPRVCGEHAHQSQDCVAHQGSSPRMRGALDL